MSFLDDARAAKSEHHERLLRAAGGDPLPEPEAEPEEMRETSFDGGARMTPPPPPESHEQTLSRLLGDAKASGRGLWWP